MGDKPILFQREMVRGILGGRKTQTRRLLKPQPVLENGAWYWRSPQYDNGGGANYFHTKDVSGIMGAWLKAMPHQVGDRLWVREGWRSRMEFDRTAPRDINLRDGVWYLADGDRDSGRKRPSIHMPRAFSRITLIVTDVRIQRLQNICEEDARAEGVLEYNWGGISAWAAKRDGLRHGNAISAYHELWDAINGHGAWDENPWVTATTFEVVNINIDQIAREAA